MKNFKLLLAGAIMIAVGSSFASVNSAVAGEYVRNDDGTYELKGDGECREHQSSTCDYTIINPSGPLDQDSNFQANEPGLWVPQ